MSAAKRWSSADLAAVIARVTPDVLALLGDGVPRTEAAIVAALAGQHPKDEVTLTVMRLDVLGQLATCGEAATPCWTSRQNKAEAQITAPPRRYRAGRRPQAGTGGEQILGMPA